MFQEDYLLRVIQQLVDAIARIAGLNRRGEHDQAVVEADQAWSDLLGVPAELAATVDSRTLAGMLREPARIRLAAQLVREQARALTGKGDAAGAAVRCRRALELWLEARATEPRGRGAGDNDEAAIGELAHVVPADQLAPRYQAMLAGRR
jgi:hypothetical protein